MWAEIQHSSQENTPCSLSPLERGEQGELLPHAILALTQGGDPSTDRRHMLPEIEIGGAPRRPC
jgi:hypothetical protein